MVYFMIITFAIHLRAPNNKNKLFNQEQWNGLFLKKITHLFSNYDIHSLHTFLVGLTVSVLSSLGEEKERVIYPWTHPRICHRPLILQKPAVSLRIRCCWHFLERQGQTDCSRWCGLCLFVTPTDHLREELKAFLSLLVGPFKRAIWNLLEMKFSFWKTNI